MTNDSYDVEERRSLLNNNLPKSISEKNRRIKNNNISAARQKQYGSGGCCKCCHPSSCFYRFLVAFTASVMCFGAQIAYDSIGAAGPYLRKTMHIHAEEIGDLYSAYHLPNIVMVILGGIFAEIFGTSIASIVFSLFVCVGTAIVAASTSFRTMLFGRLVFGIGAESLTIVQLSILSRWFSTSRTFPSLAVSMAMANCISSLGTVGAYDLIPLLGSTHVHKSLYILGYLPCVISLCITFLLIFLEWYATYVIKNEVKEERRYIVNGVIQKHEDPAMLSAEPPSKSFVEVFKGVKNFKGLYWHLVLYIVIFTGATQAYGNFATDLFVEKFSYGTIVAGRITSMSTWVAIAAVIPIGMVVDYYGHRGTLLITGSIILFGSHLFIEFVPESNKYIVMGTFGFGMAIVQAAVFPSIALTVPINMAPVAFAVVGAMMNASMVFFPYFTGHIHDISKTYNVPMYLFLTYDICCLFIGLWILRDPRDRSLLQTAESISNNEVSDDDD